ncbi:N-acetyltransferase family protein [Metabacillus sp. 84]|uniref:GNAT family N-acetyltransferase n=1 Tax=unclassified Metabacillus TaxID=2675274 RepID=UPI003CF3993F
MNVYEASIEDAEAAAHLFNEYRMFYRQPSDLEGARQFILERLEKKESVIYLAKDEHGTAAGFAQLYPSFSSVSMRKIWIVNDLFVTEQERKRGTAGQLLERAADLCRKTGAKFLNLETAADNSSAQRLYEKNQFVKVEDTFFYTRQI